MRLLAAAVLVLTVILGCTGAATGDPKPGPPKQWIGKDAEPEPEHWDEDPRIRAYTEDCRHVFAPAPELDNPNDYREECTWREFDQNCAEDHFGCFSDAEACRDGCAKPCKTCQTTCADTCEACKGGCAPSDEDCIRGCAGARNQCQSGCLSRRETCLGDC